MFVQAVKGCKRHGTIVIRIQHHVIIVGIWFYIPRLVGHIQPCHSVGRCFIASDHQPVFFHGVVVGMYDSGLMSNKAYHNNANRQQFRLSAQ